MLIICVIVLVVDNVANVVMFCSVLFWCQPENLRSRLHKSSHCLIRAAEYVTAVCMAGHRKDHRLQIFNEVSMKLCYAEQLQFSLLMTVARKYLLDVAVNK